MESARGQFAALDLRPGLVLNDLLRWATSKEHFCVSGIFYFLDSCESVWRSGADFAESFLFLGVERA